MSYSITPNIDALLDKEHASRCISFSLEFRSGQRYNHSYVVPEIVILKGAESVKEYIIREALDDILFVELEED